MGYASLQAWVLFAVIFLVTLVQWRLGQERNYGFEK
jgi:ABC-type sugar transport system permease subunit